MPVTSRPWSALLARLVLGLLALAAAGPAPAQPGGDARVALVIGNAAYASGGSLLNPVNDATDVARRLRELGFDVTLRTNVSQREFNRALTEFGERVRPGGTALFYYAGHGIQSRGHNFLIPVDAQIRQEQAVRSEAVNVDQVLDQLGAAQVGIVILDACRNSPFERAFRSSGGSGLAQVDAPKGTLIAYATAPGRVAEDGERTRNSPFTAALLRALAQPARPIEDLFKEVRRTVTQATANRQLPWESSSMTGDFFFERPVPRIASGGAGASPGPAPASAPGATADAGGPARSADLTVELAFWDAIKHSTVAADYDEYLRKYPNGAFAGLAASRRDRLEAAARPAGGAAPVAPGGGPAASAPGSPVASAGPPAAERPVEAGRPTSIQDVDGRRFFGVGPAAVGGMLRADVEASAGRLTFRTLHLARGPGTIPFSCGLFGRGAVLERDLTIATVECALTQPVTGGFADLRLVAHVSGRFPMLQVRLQATTGASSLEVLRLIPAADEPAFEVARRATPNLSTEAFARSAASR